MWSLEPAEDLSKEFLQRDSPGASLDLPSLCSAPGVSLLPKELQDELFDVIAPLDPSGDYQDAPTTPAHKFQWTQPHTVIQIEQPPLTIFRRRRGRCRPEALVVGYGA